MYVHQFKQSICYPRNFDGLNQLCPDSCSSKPVCFQSFPCNSCRHQEKKQSILWLSILFQRFIHLSCGGRMILIIYSGSCQSVSALVYMFMDSTCAMPPQLFFGKERPEGQNSHQEAYSNNPNSSSDLTHSPVITCNKNKLSNTLSPLGLIKYIHVMTVKIPFEHLDRKWQNHTVWKTDSFSNLYIRQPLYKSQVMSRYRCG